MPIMLPHVRGGHFVCLPTAEIVIEISSRHEKLAASRQGSVQLIAGTGARQVRVGSAITKRSTSGRGLGEPNVFGWPRYNGTSIATAKENADVQTEPNLDFRLGSGE